MTGNRRQVDRGPAKDAAGYYIQASGGGSGAAGRPVPPQGPHWDLDLLTPDDVCVLLKVKKSWLYDVVEDGAIEAIRLGKQLRFRPSALVRYLEERGSNGNGAGRS